tara:strand:+ start:1388 stop:1558 length:171 start_codon:yes stop_codon:yes gene_type:complete
MEIIRIVITPLNLIHHRIPTVRKDKYAKLTFFCSIKYTDRTVRRINIGSDKPNPEL